MIKDNIEIQKELEKVVAIAITFSTGHNWEYYLDDHKVWRTTHPGAPNSLWTYELAQVIKDQEDDIYFTGVIYH